MRVKCLSFWGDNEFCDHRIVKVDAPHSFGCVSLLRRSSANEKFQLLFFFWFLSDLVLLVPQ